MRFAGIHSRRGGSARLLEMSRKLDGGARSGIETLMSPASDPIVAAVVDRQAIPPLGVATEPDGSFAVVDGEVVRTGDWLGAPDSAAQSALGRFGICGLDALAELDGGFGLVARDAQRQAFLLARDRWGVVPVYSAETGDLGAPSTTRSSRSRAACRGAAPTRTRCAGLPPRGAGPLRLHSTALYC